MTSTLEAPTQDTPFVQLLEDYRARADRALHHYLPEIPEQNNRLHTAMHYAVTNGGKRVRPLLVYATGEALGVPSEALDVPASALEMIHAYSLVHDDLPAMDDDDLRRGKPTCHKQFDEATAILAGDALQAHAFQILAEGEHMLADAQTRLDMLTLLADASGPKGMALGQAIDLGATGTMLSLSELELMHRHKTGALICASVLLGAMQSPQYLTLKPCLQQYAEAIGLAFQIVDDILDVISDTQTLGKQQGADIEKNKPTYPALLGLDGARQHALSMHELALESLSGLPNEFDVLRQLSTYIVERRY